MKKISIVTFCINEEDNIQNFYNSICEIIKDYATKYFFEIIIVDDASQDNTQEILRKIAFNDRRVKLVFNSRSFGDIKTSYYAMCQSTGDVIIYLPTDMRFSSETIDKFIESWENGCEIVVAKNISKAKFSFINMLRKFYYRILDSFKDEGDSLINGYEGYGLYSRKVISKIKEINDPYPYFRGAVLNLGYTTKIIDYKIEGNADIDDGIGFIQTWNGAMLGLTRTTKVPIHIITIVGFFGTIISFIGIVLSLICYVGYVNFVIPKKMLSLYFLMFAQILSVGLIGEYIIMLCRFSENKPLVIEKERINF